VLAILQHPGFVLSAGFLSSEYDQHFRSLYEITLAHSIFRFATILRLRIYTSTLCYLRVKNATWKKIRVDAGPVSWMRFETMSTLPCFASQVDPE